MVEPDDVGITATYHLGLAWEWEYDTDFVALLRTACRARGLRLLEVTPHNLVAVRAAVTAGRLRLLTYLDRAWDADSAFHPLEGELRAQGTHIFNPLERVIRASNKATMHLEFMNLGLYVPYTLILAPGEHLNGVPHPDLPLLGTPFVVKPAHGGGGDDVSLGVTAWHEVAAARSRFLEDTCLLQAHIEPAIIEGRRAWFRVLYVTGTILPTWWDDRTHLYAPLPPADVDRLGLQQLYEITATIARISGLSFFSTEVARTAAETFVVVDYVNEPCDMRLQSRYVNGVPDDLVRQVTQALAREAANARRDA